jgi:hypothetical protein
MSYLAGNHEKLLLVIQLDIRQGVYRFRPGSANEAVDFILIQEVGMRASQTG